MNRYAIPLAASLAVVLAGCGDGDSEHERAGSSGQQAVATGSSTSAAAKESADATVCLGSTGLEGRGKGFYGIVQQFIASDGANIKMEAGALADEVRNLAKVGAAAGADDGMNAITEASAPVQFALLSLVTDARAFAEHYEEIAANRTPASGTQYGIDQLMLTFSKAVRACSDAGYRVTWPGSSEQSSSSSSPTSNDVAPFRDSEEFQQYYDDANTTLDPCKDEFSANRTCASAIVDTVEILRTMKAKLTSDYPKTKLEINKQIEKLELFADNCDGAALRDRSDEGCPIMIVKLQLASIAVAWHQERRGMGLK